MYIFYAYNFVLFAYYLILSLKKFERENKSNIFSNKLTKNIKFVLY